DSGRSIVESWSKQSAKYNRGSFQSSWKHAGIGNGFVIKFFNEAKRFGWQARQSNNSDDLIELRSKRQKQAEAQALQKKKADELKHSKAHRIAVQLISNAVLCYEHQYLKLADTKPYGAFTAEKILFNGRYFINPLLIPLYNCETHEISSVQLITPDGHKEYLKGGKADGAYFKIDGDPNKPKIITEGYKDACKTHEATGQTVICAFTANNLKTVYDVLGNEHDIIFADNDIKLKRFEDRSLKAIYAKKDLNGIGTGHKKAHAIGSKFVMSHKSGADAGDLSHDEIRQVLSGVLVSDIPVFSAWHLEKQAFSGIASKQLLQLLSKESDPLICAQIAFKYAVNSSVRLFNRSIVSLYIELLEPCKGKVHPITLDSIIEYVQSGRAYMMAQAERSINIDKYKHHNIIQPVSLENLKLDYKGVYLVKALTGTGKTRNVGKPFAKWCKENNELFLSVAHLRSLIKEMSKVLETSHYEDEKKASKQSKGRSQLTLDALSVCLPSIGHESYADFVASCRYLFIDEISQVLESLTSEEIYKNIDVSVVFNLLKHLIKNAKCLIVADANINQFTLDFIESCRPNEQFNIIEMKPKDEGKKAFIYQNETALLDKIINDVMMGKRVWISCDSDNKTQQLKTIFSMYDDINCIALNKNSHSKENEKAFLADPDAESLKYNVVIANSVISSGVSVEHRDSNGDTQPHFDYVAGFASGQSVQPTDFYQMIGRVRYIKEFHLFINQKNMDAQDVSDMIEGRQKATHLMENKWQEKTDLSVFLAELEYEMIRRKANFANNLLYILNAKCFTVSFIDADLNAGIQAEMKAINKKLKEDEKLNIIQAEKINEETALALRKKPILTDSQRNALKAYDMRLDIGLPLDAEIELEHFEINTAQLIRFSAFTGIEMKHSFSNAKKDIMCKNYQPVYAKAYALAFNGFDLSPNHVFNNEDATALLNQIATYRQMLVAIGAIPKKFGTKNWKISAYPVKDLQSILEHIGLKSERKKDSKKVQMTHILVTKNHGICTKSDVHIYQINEAHYLKMTDLSDAKFSDASLTSIDVEALQRHMETMPVLNTDNAIELKTVSDQVQDKEPSNESPYFADMPSNAGFYADGTDGRQTGTS
ncbi:MAG: plasmid replication protein, CyRepA1 family, partial [Acinetobacter sp.]